MSEPSETKPNLVDQTCELLKWSRNYRMVLRTRYQGKCRKFGTDSLGGQCGWFTSPRKTQKTVDGRHRRVVIFPLAPDQIIAQMWWNGAQQLPQRYRQRLVYNSLLTRTLQVQLINQVSKLSKTFLPKFLLESFLSSFSNDSLQFLSLFSRILRIRNCCVGFQFSSGKSYCLGKFWAPALELTLRFLHNNSTLF